MWGLGGDKGAGRGHLQGFKDNSLTVFHHTLPGARIISNPFVQCLPHKLNHAFPPHQRAQPPPGRLQGSSQTSSLAPVGPRLATPAWQPPRSLLCAGETTPWSWVCRWSGEESVSPWLRPKAGEASILPGCCPHPTRPVLGRSLHQSLTLVPRGTCHNLLEGERADPLPPAPALPVPLIHAASCPPLPASCKAVFL